MYAAAAVTLSSLAPTWVGFLTGAVPVAALAAWAFWGAPKGKMQVALR
jgi:hypothetical protein